MDEALADIKALGATWAQIHPYARISKNGAVRFTEAEQLGFLARAKTKADKAGVQLFLKPHLAYWGTFSWRGAITFTTEAQWTRFFREYTAFIVDQARFAEAHAIPLFAVGTELDATPHRKEWRDVLRAVRAVYTGKVTYAANCDSLENVPFWAKVDLIGVQAYFPVGNGTQLTIAEIESGWGRHADALRALWHRTGKKILFAGAVPERAQRIGVLSPPRLNLGDSQLGALAHGIVGLNANEGDLIPKRNVLKAVPVGR